jgi:hypothetical protein
VWSGRGRSASREGGRRREPRGGFETLDAIGNSCSRPEYQIRTPQASIEIHGVLLAIECEIP